MPKKPSIPYKSRGFQFTDIYNEWAWGSLAGFKEKQMGKELKVVRLLEPELCLRCRFAEVAEVDCENGRTERMIHCRRGDCDNWDIQDAESAHAIRVLPEH